MDLKPVNRTVQTAAELWPVELEEAKQFLQIEHDDDDHDVDRAIQAATEALQDQTGKQFIQATFDAEYVSFPCGTDALLLDRTPVSSVTSITYTDTSGNSQTWSSSLYTVETGSERRGAYIIPAWTESYPATRMHGNAVTVRYVAGFGTTRDTVPERIRQQILMRVYDLYYRRSEMCGGDGPVMAGLNSVNQSYGFV